MAFTWNVLDTPGKPDLQRYSAIVTNQVQVKFDQILDFSFSLSF